MKPAVYCKRASLSLAVLARACWQKPCDPQDCSRCCQKRVELNDCRSPHIRKILQTGCLAVNVRYCIAANSPTDIRFLQLTCWKLFRRVSSKAVTEDPKPSHVSASRHQSRSLGLLISEDQLQLPSSCRRRPVNKSEVFAESGGDGDGCCGSSATEANDARARQLRQQQRRRRCKQQHQQHETKVLALLKQVTCTACHLCIEQGTWLVHAGPAQAAAVQLPRIEDQAGFLTWEK